MTDHDRNAESPQSGAAAAAEQFAVPDGTTVGQVGVELHAPTETPKALEATSAPIVGLDAETCSTGPTAAEDQREPVTGQAKAGGKKTRASRKGPKAERVHDGATQGPAGARPAGNAAQADSDGPMGSYLWGSSLEPAPIPAEGTLPPQLEVMFPDLISVAAVLAVTAAAAGQSDTAGFTNDEAGKSSALRVAAVGEERSLPAAVGPVLEAAYALEQKDVLRWNAEKQKLDLMSASDAARRRLHQQTVINADLLGIELNGCLGSETAADTRGVARPRFVLRDPAPNEVTRSLAAARSGLLLVDGRRLPTAAGFGVNYDLGTAALLNGAAMGHPIELADPQLSGCIRMRPIAVSVIGVLSTVDVYSLHKVGLAALAATIFVPAGGEAKSPPTRTDFAETLADILARVRDLAAGAQELGAAPRFSAAARKALQQVNAKLLQLSAEVESPLSSYYRVVPDLMRRIAIILHLLDHAVRRSDSLPAEIDKQVVARSIAFVEKAALPAARNVLAVASVDPALRDARRIVSLAQWYCGPEHATLQRRDVVRIFQRSMGVPAVDRAIGRLVKDGLLIRPNPDGAEIASRFQINLAVFDPKNQLPDLVTDPRRPKA